MSKFNLSAQLQLQAPKNAAAVSKQLQSQFGTIPVNVKVNANAKAVRAASSAIGLVNTESANASRSVNELSRTLGVAARRFGAISIATGVFLGLTRAVKNSISEAIKFERELNKITQATGATGAAIKNISDEVSRLSTSLGVSSSELVQASRLLAQAGFSAKNAAGTLKILAQTDLAATFDSIQDTTEGVVAIIQQFGKEATRAGREVQFLEESLSAINAVSKQFAVESADIISAIRKTGGAFEAAGGDINELIALFTSVRATTRESADTIATGFRTIFTRLQRSDTVEALEKLGIELQDVEGKFVGPMEAVKRLSTALSVLDSKDYRFSKIVEELGGYRQISKVIPLIQQFSLAQEALSVAQGASGSLAQDAATAQKTLAVEIAKVKEEFTDLIRKFTDSDTFRSIANGALTFARALIKVADAIRPVLPLVASFAAIKLGKSLIPALGAFAGIGKNNGGKIHAFASGGFVPGAGNTDTVPAMLTPGEFVIRKSAAKKLGASTLEQMNRNGYNKGGTIVSDPPPPIGALILAPSNKVNSNPVDIDMRKSIAEKKFFGPETYKLTRAGIDESLKENLASDIRANLKAGLVLTVNDAGKSMADTIGIEPPIVKPDDVDKFLKSLGEGPVGSVFEALIAGLKGGPFEENQSRPFDFEGSIGPAEKLFGDKTKGFMYRDAKNSMNSAQPNKFVSKIRDQAAIEMRQAKGLEGANRKGLDNLLKQREFSSGAALVKYLEKNKQELNIATSGNKQKAADRVGEFLEGTGYELIATPQGQGFSYEIVAREQMQGRANGGAPRGTDTVPAMLTPGEYVVNKESAKKIGYDKLNKLNKTGDVQYLNKGGPVLHANDGGKITDDDILGWLGEATNSTANLNKEINGVVKSLAKAMGISEKAAKGMIGPQPVTAESYGSSGSLGPAPSRSGGASIDTSKVDKAVSDLAKSLAKTSGISLELATQLLEAGAQGSAGLANIASTINTDALKQGISQQVQSTAIVHGVNLETAAQLAELKIVEEQIAVFEKSIEEGRKLAEMTGEVTTESQLYKEAMDEVARKLGGISPQLEAYAGAKLTASTQAATTSEKPAATGSTTKPEKESGSGKGAEEAEKGLKSFGLTIVNLTQRLTSMGGGIVAVGMNLGFLDESMAKAATQAIATGTSIFGIGSEILNATKGLGDLKMSSLSSSKAFQSFSKVMPNLSSGVLKSGDKLSAVFSKLGGSGGIASGVLAGLAVGFAALQYIVARTREEQEKAAKSASEGLKKVGETGKGDINRIKEDSLKAKGLGKKADDQMLYGAGGVAAGAVAGAAIGSVIPVVGTLIGGIIGGVAGAAIGSSFASDSVNKAEVNAVNATVDAQFLAAKSSYDLSQTMNELRQRTTVSMDSLNDWSKGLRDASQNAVDVEEAERKAKIARDTATLEKDNSRSWIMKAAWWGSGPTEDDKKADEEGKKRTEEANKQAKEFAIAQKGQTEQNFGQKLSKMGARQLGEMSLDQAISTAGISEAMRDYEEGLKKVMKDPQEVEKAMDGFRKNLEDQFKAAAEQAQKQALAMAARKAEIDMILKTNAALGQLTAAAQKSAALQSEIDRAIATATGAFQSIPLSTEVFNDLSNVGDQGAFADAARAAAAPLGPAGQEIATQVISAVGSIDKLRTGLNNLSLEKLNDPKLAGSGGTEDITSMLSEMLGDDFAKLGPTMQKLLVNKVKGTISEKGQDFNESDVEDILSAITQATQKQAEVLKKSTDMQNDYLNKYNQVTGAIIASMDKEASLRSGLVGITQKGTDRMAEVFQGRVDTGMLSKMKQKSRIDSEQALLGPELTAMGIKAGDTSGLGNQLRSTKSQMRDNDQELKRKDISVERRSELERQNQKLGSQANKLTESLTKLTDQSDRASDVMSDIAKEKAKRDFVSGQVEDLVFGDQESRMKMSETYQGAAMVAQTGSFQMLPDEMKKGVGDLLKQMADAGDGRAKQIRQQAIFNDAVSMGVSPEVARTMATATPKEEKLINDLWSINQQEQAAQKELMNVEMENTQAIKQLIPAIESMLDNLKLEIETTQAEIDDVATNTVNAASTAPLAPLSNPAADAAVAAAATQAVNSPALDQAMQNLTPTTTNVPDVASVASAAGSASGGGLFNVKDSAPREAWSAGAQQVAQAQAEAASSVEEAVTESVTSTDMLNQTAKSIENILIEILASIGTIQIGGSVGVAGPNLAASSNAAPAEKAVSGMERIGVSLGNISKNIQETKIKDALATAIDPLKLRETFIGKNAMEGASFGAKAIGKTYSAGLDMVGLGGARDYMVSKASNLMNSTVGETAASAGKYTQIALEAQDITGLGKMMAKSASDGFNAMSQGLEKSDIVQGLGDITGLKDLKRGFIQGGGDQAQTPVEVAMGEIQSELDNAIANMNVSGEGASTDAGLNVAIVRLTLSVKELTEALNSGSSQLAKTAPQSSPGGMFRVKDDASRSAAADKVAKMMKQSYAAPKPKASEATPVSNQEMPVETAKAIQTSQATTETKPIPNMGNGSAGLGQAAAQAIVQGVQAGGMGNIQNAIKSQDPLPTPIQAVEAQSLSSETPASKNVQSRKNEGWLEHRRAYIQKDKDAKTNKRMTEEIRLEKGIGETKKKELAEQGVSQDEILLMDRKEKVQANYGKDSEEYKLAEADLNTLRETGKAPQNIADYRKDEEESKAYREKKYAEANSFYRTDEEAKTFEDEGNSYIYDSLKTPERIAREQKIREKMNQEMVFYDKGQDEADEKNMLAGKSLSGEGEWSADDTRQNTNRVFERRKTAAAKMYGEDSDEYKLAASEASIGYSGDNIDRWKEYEGIQESQKQAAIEAEMKASQVAIPSPPGADAQAGDYAEWEMRRQQIEEEARAAGKTTYIEEAPEPPPEPPAPTEEEKEKARVAQGEQQTKARWAQQREEKAARIASGGGTRQEQRQQFQNDRKALISQARVVRRAQLSGRGGEDVESMVQDFSAKQQAFRESYSGGAQENAPNPQAAQAMQGGQVAYNSAGGQPAQSGQVPSQVPNTLKETFDNFINAVPKIFETSLAGFTESATMLAESFKNIHMTHEVNLNGQINIAGFNTEAIAESIKTSIADFIVQTVSKQLSDKANQFKTG